MREKIKRSLLIDQFLKTNVDSRAVVTAAELKAYYDKNPPQFQYAESFWPSRRFRSYRRRKRRRPS